MAAPPFLSNIWFPPHERITATGVTTLMNYMGKSLRQSWIKLVGTKGVVQVIITLMLCVDPTKNFMNSPYDEKTFLV